MARTALIRIKNKGRCKFDRVLVFTWTGDDREWHTALERIKEKIHPAFRDYDRPRREWIVHITANTLGALADIFPNFWHAYGEPEEEKTPHPAEVF